MQFVINQNYPERAYNASKAVAEAAGLTLFGNPGCGFLRIRVADSDEPTKAAVGQLLDEAGLLVVARTD